MGERPHPGYDSLLHLLEQSVPSSIKVTRGPEMPEKVLVSVNGTCSPGEQGVGVLALVRFELLPTLVVKTPRGRHDRNRHRTMF